MATQPLRPVVRPAPAAPGKWAWRVPAALQVAPIYLFLFVFIVYPLLRLFYDAFTDAAGAFTLRHVVNFFTDPFFVRSSLNSLLLGLSAVVICSVLGFAIAYLLLRFDFPGRNAFTYLSLVPLIMPPIVGVMGFVFILGRMGTVNVILMDYFGLRYPINFMYGWHGVLVVMTLHLFPLIVLSLWDALEKVDASLEEAAESVGASRWGILRHITIPLTTPGFITGAFLVFVWAFADFATPLIVGVHDLLATQAYLNIVQFVDRRLFQMGIVTAVIMVLISLVTMVVFKRYVSLKDYATLSYRSVERRPLRGWRAWLCTAFFLVVLSLAFIPYLGVTLASFGRAWALTPFPTQYSLDYFVRIIVHTPLYVQNTLTYSVIAVLLCLVIGVPAAWVLARVPMRANSYLDAVLTLVLALPGTAVGIAYVRAFNAPLPVIGVTLATVWFVMPLVLGMRRMPYTVRSTYSSLLVLHPSLEESARSVGASGLRVFKDITVPLVWKGVLAGALFSFMTSVQEAAATLFLAMPQWATMTVGILVFFTSGSTMEAAALGFLLIVLGMVTMFAILRLGGGKAGGFFG